MDQARVCRDLAFFLLWPFDKHLACTERVEGPETEDLLDAPDESIPERSTLRRRKPASEGPSQGKQETAANHDRTQAGQELNLRSMIFLVLCAPWLAALHILAGALLMLMVVPLPMAKANLKMVLLYPTIVSVRVCKSDLDSPKPAGVLLWCHHAGGLEQVSQQAFGQNILIFNTNIFGLIVLIYGVLPCVRAIG